MTSTQVKNKVRDKIERGFDKLHRFTDIVTFPFAPLDGAIHGTARGILNWVTDNHPSSDKPNPNNKPSQPNFGPNPGQQAQGYPYPPNGSSGINTGQTNISGIDNKTGDNYGNDNGAVKIGNFDRAKKP